MKNFIEFLEDLDDGRGGSIAKSRQGSDWYSIKNVVSWSQGWIAVRLIPIDFINKMDDPETQPFRWNAFRVNIHHIIRKIMQTLGLSMNKAKKFLLDPNLELAHKYRTEILVLPKRKRHGGVAELHDGSGNLIDLTFKPSGKTIHQLEIEFAKSIKK